MKRPRNKSSEPATGSGVRFVVGILIVGFLALMVWAAVSLNRREPVARAQFAAARGDAPAIMRSLATRPGAIAGEAGNEEVRGKRRVRITYWQMFDAPGSLSAAVDWYAGQLTADGWRLTERDEHHARLDKDSWSIRIEGGYVSSMPDPSCRYKVRLDWID